MFSGESAWVDVFDWSPSVIGRPAPFGPAQVDEIARRGAQVLFIQTSRWNRSEDVVDPALLRAIIASAHARGMRVVGWYLPTFVDMATDVRRFGAMRAAGVDGIAVDIEDTTVDAPTRSQRLVFESFLLRWWLPGTPMGAVTLPNVVTDVISPGYWPGFPWRQIAGFYDVWLPMSYWTNRTVASGYRDAYRYTSENIDRLRNALGNANAPVVPVGGIADHTTAADVTGFVRAATERRAIGGGLYDVRTTAPALWSPLLSFRR